jgi:hypothetical protein
LPSELTVRTEVTLTNATDEAQARRGQISAFEVRTYRAEALVRESKMQNLLPARVVRLLGLETTGERMAERSDDDWGLLPVTEAVGIEIYGRATIEDALVAGDEIIVGQTVLNVLDLRIDLANRRLIPNPAHPEGPVIKIKAAV